MWNIQHPPHKEDKIGHRTVVFAKDICIIPNIKNIDICILKKISRIKFKKFSRNSFVFSICSKMMKKFQLPRALFQIDNLVLFFIVNRRKTDFALLMTKLNTLKLYRMNFLKFSHNWIKKAFLGANFNLGIANLSRKSGGDMQNK